MSENVGPGSVSDAALGSHSGDSDGLIDVSGMTFAELSDIISTTDLNRALDHILAAGQTGSGYHGFNSSI
jgi:hypothetical protein